MIFLFIFDKNRNNLSHTGPVSEIIAGNTGNRRHKKNNRICFHPANNYFSLTN